MLVTTFADACGLEYLYDGNSAYGHATVAASCARDNLSYAHELGHNMGRARERRRRRLLRTASVKV
jgi:hypothetical protein